MVATATVAAYYDPDHVLPFSLEDALAGLTLGFTYDSNASGVPGLDNGARYVSAISAMGLTVGTVDIQPWPDREISIANDQVTGGSAIDSWSAETKRITTLVPGELERTELFRLILLSNTAIPVPPLDSVALTMPSWPSGWQVGRIDYVVLDAYPMVGSYVVRASAAADLQNLIATPAPPVAWLLAAAFLTMVARQRRTGRRARKSHALG